MRCLVTGGGSFVLAGANTYSGGTQIDEGSVQLVAAATLGSGGTDIEGGTLQLAPGSVLFCAALTDNGILDLNGSDLTIGSICGTGTVESSFGGADPDLQPRR